MSEIIFIIAKIGGGKSLHGTRAVLEELSKSERMVVTNLPMWLSRESSHESAVGDGGWRSRSVMLDGGPYLDASDGKHMTAAEWCHKYVTRPVRVPERLRILKRDEVKTFYRHYPGFDLTGGPVSVVPRARKLQVKEGVVEVNGVDELSNLSSRQALQASGVLPYGCLFVIDEVHLYFSARDWQGSGPGIEQYMSQLRKFNDDLILITQHPDKVDKNFRRNATEWLYLTNMSKIRLWGGVSFKNRFRYATFPVEPQRGDEPQKTGMLRLDEREYHMCYDTMAGVGLSGALLPEAAKVKGGHWSRWVALVIVLLVVGAVVPMFVMRLVQSGVHSAMRGVVATAKKGIIGAGLPVGVVDSQGRPALGSLDSTNGKSARGSNGVAGEVVVTGSSHVKVSTNVFWIGTATRGGHVAIILSDGSLYHDNDGYLQYVGPSWVKIDGTLYEKESPAQTKARLSGETERDRESGQTRRASALFGRGP